MSSIRRGQVRVTARLEGVYCCIYDGGTGCRLSFLMLLPHHNERVSQEFAQSVNSAIHCSGNAHELLYKMWGNRCRCCTFRSLSG